MGSLLSSVYQALPKDIQNIAISAYGFKEYRKRYCQPLPVLYSDIEAHVKLSYEETRSRQNARLKELIQHATQYVPYYKAFFEKAHLNPQEVDIDNFQKLIPVLEKAEVVASPDRFVSSALKEDAFPLFTSGTSGSPLPICCAREARAINYAYYRAMLARYGCDVRDPSATFAGRILVSKGESKVFWRKDFFNKTLFLSSYHITDVSIPRYIEAMEAWAPVFIDSYPSAIGEIARYINAHNVKHTIKPKVVLTSSETLSELQKDNISRAFSCPVLDQYGCTEMAVWAHLDFSQRYYVEPLYSLVEFGEPDDAGNCSLVCTGLLNMAMPLIRYKIGDSVSGPNSDTEHPFYNQTFGAIAGRDDDLVVTPEGRKVGRLDPAFKGVEGIKQAQIVQTSIGELRVLVVPLDNSNREKTTAILIKNLQERTSRTMNVSVEFVEAIALSKSGKFKSVVSKVGRQ